MSGDWHSDEQVDYITCKELERDDILIKVAIIERETACAEYLRKLLLQWSDAKTDVTVSVFPDGHSFLDEERMRILELDIVFLDVGLDQMDGIAVAGKLRAIGFMNTIVFTADHGTRAIEGYRVSAYQYYIKPIPLSDIWDCMDYVLDRRVKEYFQYTYHGVTSRIAFCDIICFESMEHYIYIRAKGQTIKIKGSLKDAQEQCPSCFVRCQRSYIVNSNHIQEKKGKTLWLGEDIVVDISPKYSKAVADIMRIKKASQPLP